VVNAVVGIGDVPAGDVAPEADVAIVVHVVSVIQQALHGACPLPTGLSSRVKPIGVVVMYLVALNSSARACSVLDEAILRIVGNVLHGETFNDHAVRAIYYLPRARRNLYGVISWVVCQHYPAIGVHGELPIHRVGRHLFERLSVEEHLPWAVKVGRGPST
jgi:hypothetical protein